MGPSAPQGLTQVFPVSLSLSPGKLESNRTHSGVDIHTTGLSEQKEVTFNFFPSPLPLFLHRNKICFRLKMEKLKGNNGSCLCVLKEIPDTNSHTKEQRQGLLPPQS